jgi:hypothetical protein
MMPEPLVVPTRSAHWGWDEHRYFGHKVFEELTGSESFIGLNALAVVGRRLSPECCGLLEDAATALTLADPRIWPLKLTRVVAAYGGMPSAAAAGLLVQQSAQIGPWVCARAAETLLEFRTDLGDRFDDATLAKELVEKHLAKHRFIWGFGTPFRNRDERLVAFGRCVERRERHGLPHWKTMEILSTAARDIRGVEPNIGLAVAAACLDMGLDPTQIGPLVIALVSHMFIAHAVEGARQRSEVLRELPDEYVSASTREARQSPRATRSRSLAPHPTGSHVSTPSRGRNRIESGEHGIMLVKG